MGPFLLAYMYTVASHILKPISGHCFPFLFLIKTSKKKKQYFFWLLFFSLVNIPQSPFQYALMPPLHWSYSDQSHYWVTSMSLNTRVHSWSSSWAAFDPTVDHFILPEMFSSHAFQWHTLPQCLLLTGLLFWFFLISISLCWCIDDSGLGHLLYLQSLPGWSHPASLNIIYDLMTSKLMYYIWHSSPGSYIQLNISSWVSNNDLNLNIIKTEPSTIYPQMCST